MQYKFHLNNLRIAPRKVRQVVALIKKMPVQEAEALLKFQGKRAAPPVLKLLKSGVASAANNFSLSPEDLHIFNIFVDEGPMLKRFMPRAFGRAGAIHKKTSHITLVLEEKIGGGRKKKKVESLVSAKGGSARGGKTSEDKEKIDFIAPKEIKPKRKLESIARRIFRRKAIG
ncbi:50S ribosomal protein L22 [Patescibacteria group bacterium]|nr:50S ribosomal protein L22 [Patescibacteria group bacterium]